MSETVNKILQIAENNELIYKKLANTADKEYVDALVSTIELSVTDDGAGNVTISTRKA